MHILYDHDIFARQPFGGVSRYFSEIIPRIARQPDTSVSLFMGLHVNEYDLPAHRATFRNFAGWRRPSWRTGRLAAPINAWLFRRFASRARGVDIYHPTSYRDFLPGFPGRFIVTLHDLITERLQQSPVDEYNRNKRQALMRADGIICISETTRRDLHELFGRPHARVTVIRHATSLTSAAGDRPCAAPYLLFVGGRGGYKNFRVLLAAYANSVRLRQSAHLICFGGGSWSATEQEELHRLGVATVVHHVAGDDRLLARYYTHALAFVFPSRYEGFGMPLLEAMGCGCPVVASHASCLPEIGGEAALYFDPADQDDLAEKIDRLLSDHELRESMIRAGRDRQAQFSWDRSARETLEFYRQVVDH